MSEQTNCTEEGRGEVKPSSCQHEWQRDKNHPRHFLCQRCGTAKDGRRATPESFPKGREGELAGLPGEIDAASGVPASEPTRWCPECRSAGVVGIEQDVCPTCDGTGKVADGVPGTEAPSFDVEAMLRECVPVGSFFGSLKVANAIRAYFAAHGVKGRKP